MAELSFDRKYRPTSLVDGFMGKENKEILLTRFSDEKLYPHTILFYGERGCGKTTSARILAKEYLCYNKVDGHACGICEMCQDIDEKLIFAEAGSSNVPNITELDIATDSGKAAMDEALEDALIPPMYPDKYKIFIFDECHMATKQAQNRLLKLAEDTPDHLILMFCTTNPENMLETLKDRCRLKIQVKKATEGELVERLLYGCKQEGIKTSKEALKIIVKHAQRNPRNAWILLEQVAKANNNEVTLDTVSKSISKGSNETYVKYIKAAKNGLEDILRFVNQLRDTDNLAKEFMRGLTKFVIDCNNIKYAIGIDMYPIEFVRQAKELFKDYNVNELDQLLQIIEYANNQLNISGDNPEYAELILVTTAMRIGKAELLSKGLQNELQRGLVENARGNSIAVEKGEKELKDIPIIKEQLGGALLQSVMGNKVKEVTCGEDVLLEDNDEDTNEEDETEFFDDAALMDLLKFDK